MIHKYIRVSDLFLCLFAFCNVLNASEDTDWITVENVVWSKKFIYKFDENKIPKVSNWQMEGFKKGPYLPDELYKAALAELRKKMLPKLGIEESDVRDRDFALSSLKLVRLSNDSYYWVCKVNFILFHMHSVEIPIYPDGKIPNFTVANNKKKQDNNNMPGIK